MMEILIKLMTIVGWFLLVTAYAIVVWIVVINLLKKKIIGGVGAGVICAAMAFLALWITR
ncbi:hypothetical protein G5574_07815 [Pantoea stewartii]|uniref:hypothetical protein n=1 Tax=Pantoea stewartii TaxID=66269 RepID=UPI0013DE4256|nr:hypothetical protein [Pantoea stewartii]QIE96868.1 hypothetical protein G5574_07815 [Pantoea stewartii]